MPIFALLIYPPEGTDMGPDRRASLRAWVKDLQDQGKLVYQTPFFPPGAANFVEKRNDEVVIEKGPVSNELHVVCGAEFIHCASLEEAMELASRHPSLVTPGTKVEVRQTWRLEDLD